MVIDARLFNIFLGKEILCLINLLRLVGFGFTLHVFEIPPAGVGCLFQEDIITVFRPSFGLVYRLFANRVSLTIVPKKELPSYDSYIQ